MTVPRFRCQLKAHCLTEPAARRDILFLSDVFLTYLLTSAVAAPGEDIWGYRTRLMMLDRRLLLGAADPVWGCCWVKAQLFPRILLLAL